MNFAVSRKIGFLAQGGRHGYAPELQKIQNGILINLEQLDHVRLDSTTGIATVGGGTVYSQVIDAVYAAGREMSTGAVTFFSASKETDSGISCWLLSLCRRSRCRFGRRSRSSSRAPRHEY